MSKKSEIYPRLHGITRCEVLLVTVVEGDGTQESPAYELTYVCKVENGEYRVIGELYDCFHEGDGE